MKLFGDGQVEWLSVHSCACEVFLGIHWDAGPVERVESRMGECVRWLHQKVQKESSRKTRTDRHIFHFSFPPPRHSLVTAIEINRCRSYVRMCAIITGCHHHGLVHYTNATAAGWWHSSCCIAVAAGSMQSAATSFSSCYFTTLLADATGRPYYLLRPLHGQVLILKLVKHFLGRKLMCGDFVVKNDDLFGVEIIRLTLFFLISLSLSRKMINDLLFWYYTHHSYSYGRCLSSAVLSDFLSFFLFFFFL